LSFLGTFAPWREPDDVAAGKSQKRDSRHGAKHAKLEQCRFCLSSAPLRLGEKLMPLSQANPKDAGYAKLRNTEACSSLASLRLGENPMPLPPRFQGRKLQIVW